MMDKLKGNAFWLVILAVLVVELVAYVVVVRGTAEQNAKSIGTLEKQKRSIQALEANAVNLDMIEAAEKHKQELEREYTRMVLFLIGKDDNLDHFGPDAGVAPGRVLRMTDWQRTALGDFLVKQRQQMEAEAIRLGLTGAPPARQPWDFVELKGKSSDKVRLYAYKQLWVQKELFEIMKKPSPTALASVAPPPAEAPAPAQPAGTAAAQAETEAEAGAETEDTAEPPSPQPKSYPLVASIDEINFTLPQKGELFDPLDRYICHTVNVKVTMYATDVPVFLERILKSELPMTIDSYRIGKSTMDNRRITTLADRPTSGMVDVSLVLRVLDFQMGIGKVTFSGEKFPTPEDVEAWLEDNDDPVIAVIRRQIAKPGVRPRRTDEGIEYSIYGDPERAGSLLDPGRAMVECEIEPGVTIVCGRLVIPMPEAKN